MRNIFEGYSEEDQEKLGEIFSRRLEDWFLHLDDIPRARDFSDTVRKAVWFLIRHDKLQELFTVLIETMEEFEESEVSNAPQEAEQGQGNGEEDK